MSQERRKREEKGRKGREGRGREKEEILSQHS